jgi:hypothetical protein
LCLSIAIKDSVFSCSVSTKKQERIIPGLLELGTFDKPFSIRVSSRKASSVKLSAKDEEGKAIDNFYAVGYYPNLSGYIDGSIIWLNDTMESNVRIKPEKLKKRFLDPIELAVRYNFSRSFEMQSQVTFFWDHINKTAQISNIIPNEKVIIILYDKQGRQGHIETTLTENENKEFVVVLENNQ